MLWGAGLYFGNKRRSNKIIDNEKEYLVRPKSAAVFSFSVPDKVVTTCLLGLSSEAADGAGETF